MTTKANQQPILHQDLAPNVLSFLPKYTQQAVASGNSGLEKLFLGPIPLSKFNDKSLGSALAKQWKVKLQKVATIFQFTTDEIDRLQRLIVTGLEYETYISCSDFELDLESLHFFLDGSDPSSAVLHFVTCFKRIRRLTLNGKSSNFELLSTVLRSLPRLDALLVVNSDALAISLAREMSRRELNQLIPFRPTLQMADHQGERSDTNVLYRETEIPRIVSNGAVCKVVKTVFNPHLMTTHHVSNNLSSLAIDALLCNKLALPTKEKIEQLLMIVSHCTGFLLSSSSWLRLVRRQEFQPVYQAIVHKILNGQTIHYYRKGHHQKLFNPVTLQELLSDLDNLDVFFKLSADGIRFNHLDNFPENCSLLVYHALVQNDIFPHLSFELLDFPFIYGSISESPFVEEVKQAVEQHTDTQIHTKRWVEVLSDQIESIDLVRKTLLDIKQHKDKIISLIWSLRQEAYKYYWRFIFVVLFNHEEAEVIQWLLELEPAWRDYIQKKVSKLKAQEPSFLFERWLISHKFELPYLLPKRKRLPSLEEELPAKKHKLDSSSQDCT